MASVNSNIPTTPTGGMAATPSPQSPFAQGRGNYRQSPNPLQQGDSLQTQNTAKGLPVANVLHDKPSSLSPFNRPDGKPVDFLNPPQTNPGPVTTPQKEEPAPIVFMLPKEIPTGPAIANIDQLVLQEVQPVQQPGQAIQLIAGHCESAKSNRETTNRLTWGARYYSVQAAEMAEQIFANKDKLSPEQIKTYQAKVTEYRDQAIGYLNEAKKSAILTYNESLKANLIYNHFFTSTGSMINTIDEPTRTAIKDELEQTWARWEGSFEKEWQGKQVQAQGVVALIDATSQEVAAHVHRMNSVLSQFAP